MNLAEVLKEIGPCDTQKPYIFISYSSNDKELVWQDALEFQQRGYNIWLDEKNLDKTKASWTEDALRAIEDMYCMLVVFYVSKSSLISEACYRELAKTTDELTVALHFGPVKFIAIDVDEVGNIGDFTRELHQSIFMNAEISKEIKSKMLLTLHQFMKDFFDSNNEKVRVHPKNEPNRKMNYYEEIVASFPDTARNMEIQVTPQEEADEETLRQQEASAREAEEAAQAAVAQAAAEAAAKAYAEVEAKLRAEAQARVQAEAEVAAKFQAEAAARAQVEAELKAWKEAAARMQAETEAKAQEEAIRQEQANRKAQEAALQEARMRLTTVLKQAAKKKREEELVQEAARQFMNGDWFAKFQKQLTMDQVKAAVVAANGKLSDTRKYMSVLKAGDKKMKNAISAYAKTVAISDILALVDTTIFGSAKEGFLVTRRGLYSDNFKGGMIDFNRLDRFQTGRKDYYLDVYYTDGTKQELFVASVYRDIVDNLLTAILEQKQQ